MSNRAETFKIAKQLVENCRTENELQGLEQLYAPNAISSESLAMEGQDSHEVTGVDAIKAKHEWWNSSFEVHSASVDGPFLHGDSQFSVIFELDATEKASGSRMPFKEVALYTVENGKISKEQFFYNGPGEE